MKWCNQGHEFDELSKKYEEMFSKKEIFLFGAGKLGRKCWKILRNFDQIRGFIDNKVTGNYCGLNVYSLGKYINHSEKSFLIVCANNKNAKEIISQLQNQGLKEMYDFVKYDIFFRDIYPIYLMYEKDRFYLDTVQISLTERCTLKCRKCAHACHLVPMESPDLDCLEVCRSCDVFFSFVDYVDQFVLLGGEPFLYKDLRDVIVHAGKFRKRMGSFEITTNGTIIPSDDVLNEIKRNDVSVHISNYLDAVPKLQKQYDKLMRRLKDYGIDFHLDDREKWMDYGFDFVDRKANSKILEKVFDECRTVCHEIRKNRFYFCIMARSVAENMGKNVGKKDYFDLEKLDPNRKEDKMKFFEYTRGYSKKGYLDMCNYCNGADCYKFPIPAAEQMDLSCR